MVLGMVVPAPVVAEQHGEGNSRRVRVQSLGSDSEQQASHKHANDPCRREYRACRGYR